MSLYFWFAKIILGVDICWKNMIIHKCKNQVQWKSIDSWLIYSYADRLLTDLKTMRYIWLKNTQKIYQRYQENIQFKKLGFFFQCIY